MRPMRALILVDLQNDFMPGGALAVPEGDAVVPIANALAAQSAYSHVIATQDWHPAEHGSFAVHHAGRSPGEVIELHGLTQVLWPVHCVQGTRGAAFIESLESERITRVFPKGTDPTVDSYSGFFDNGQRNSTGLDAYLKDQRVDAVDVLGLATDYCVKFTALDAARLGFVTRLVVDGCRGVNLSEGDSERAIAAMRAAGVEIVHSRELT
ncbi:MAG: bifunctional nicotinamidase/pyrazinamidase [Myxococcales bacterium]|nr:bifunctional nicotinamidase/pyrazinamidase [Myxococcales bacterium]